MTTDYICDMVAEIKSKYNEGNPFRLAEAMRILLLREPMGTTPGCCKGFFMVISSQPVIAVNSDLPPVVQKIIAAHEVGHAVLHRHLLPVMGFHDFELYDAASEAEYEANIFAAEFLLDDQEVIEKLNDDLSFFQAAAALHVPAELLSFKFRVMKRRGLLVIDSPIVADSRFLKKIPTENRE